MADIYFTSDDWVIHRAPFLDDEEVELAVPEGMVLHGAWGEWRFYRTARPGELEE